MVCLLHKSFSLGDDLVLRLFKRVLMFTMAFVSVIPAVPCKKEPKKEKSSITLAEKICEEAQKVADFKELSLEEVARITYENAMRIFNI